MSLSTLGPVVLVGAGKMGLALARGWLAAGLRPDHLVLVSPSLRPDARRLADETGARLVADVAGLAPRILVLAVKPQKMAGVMAEIRPVVGPETLVVSVAAGISIAALSAGLGTEKIVRTMPNTPAQVGRGMTGAVAGPAASPADRDAVDALMRASGKVLWFDEEARIDGVTAISGSGPAYVFYLVEALAEAAKAQGFGADDAMALARQTVIGAAALLEADPQPASVLRQNVTSPNGTTAAALAVLMAEDGLQPLLHEAVAAARRRSEELGR